jgi:hypothetical protein
MASRPRKKVAVFGAGIAGLTAAHELVERGFKVTVYEPTPPLSVLEQTCGIGGMARTQVGRIEKARNEAPEPQRMCSTEPVVELGNAMVTFDPASAELDADARGTLDAIADVLRRHRNIRHVLIRGWMADPGAMLTRGPIDRIDYARAEEVRRYLEHARVAPDRLSTEAWGFGRSGTLNCTPRDRSYVDLSIDEDLVPGEHGFRFFPAFYRHVFDTMLRIPIAADDPDVYVETGRTVRDNVIPTYSQGVNFEDRKSFVLPRRPVHSFRETFDLLRQAYDAMGFTTTDVQRLGLKLFKYATSCTARRAGEYENTSWWDFVEGDRYSERFQRYIDSAPQLLVAMRAKASDARTMGNIAVQLMLDPFRGDQRTDGTLNAPTTLAWFKHWYRYLDNQQVRFENAALVSFVRVGNRLLPQLRYPDDTMKSPPGFDYCIVALSPQAAQEVVETAGLVGGDFDKIRRLDLGDPTRSDPGGTVDHLSGIQYYFASDVKFVPGHTVFPDSAWGLSAIAQPQFWMRRRGSWDGYLGLISVDIGNWHAESPFTRKCAWDSTKDQIADEVWRQIRATLPENEGIPDPMFYHLDQNIEFGTRGPRRGLPVRNGTPLVINRTDSYADRPGRPGDYRVDEGGVVFAGTYMQTHTRLTTMEAANESGRHAVNAILKAEEFAGDWCMIADPERYEIEDLRWLVEIDEALWKLDLPHFLDILRVEELPDLLYDPVALARLLAPYLRAAGRPGPGLRVAPV